MPNCFHGMSSSLSQFVYNSRLVTRLLYNQHYQFKNYAVTECVCEFFADATCVLLYIL